MEVLFLGVIIALLANLAESHARSKLYQPTICLHCDQWVFWEKKNRRWIHADGRQRAEWPDPRVPLHTAVPWTEPLTA